MPCNPMMRHIATRALRLSALTTFALAGVLATTATQAAPFGVGAAREAAAQSLNRQAQQVARSHLQVAAPPLPGVQTKKTATAPKQAHSSKAVPQSYPEPAAPEKSIGQSMKDLQKKATGGSPVGAHSVVRGASIRDQAFSNASRMLMPMTPNQIQTLHELYSNSQRAIARSASTPPKPTTTELALNIAPGSTPPVIRLSAGFVTSVALLDATSSPWPIEWIDVGNPKDYNVQWDKKSNVMIIQALTTYGSANMALKLVGMPTPIMITLMPGQKVVDYRVDLRVPGIGPNGSQASSAQGLPSMGDPVILSVLNGIPPRGSVTLQVAGGPARAWLIHNQVYLRTRLTVISPSWISQLSSGDGTHVYVLPVSPIVLAMDHGRMVTLTVKHDG